MKKMSKRGLELLIQAEGKRNHMYHDVVGYPTIGVGHLLSRAEILTGQIRIKGVTYTWNDADGLSDTEVEYLLAQDLDRYEASLERHITPSSYGMLTENQVDALLSFTFNIGTGAFRKSTLLKRLKQKNFDDVPTQLRRWTKAGGRNIPGLVNRREHEVNIWEGTA